MVAVDLRLPWVTAISGSRSDIDASSSTALHSIYGSQVRASRNIGMHTAVHGMSIWLSMYR